MYRLDRIPLDCWRFITATDYEFFFESLSVLHIAEVPIGEITINLPARAYGHSKMRFLHMIKGLLGLFSRAIELGATRRRIMSQLSMQVSSGLHDPKKIREEWDVYWESKHKETARRFYDVVARFYRDYLIKPTLNRAIRNTFSPGDRLLHAGCGGGEVDAGVVSYAKVTALDISPNALERYRMLHDGRCECVIGDIFNLSNIGKQFNGIYNLGVMEHFQEHQIRAILKQFHQVLTKDGRIVLFWPPVYGLSVIALHTIHFVLNRILRRNIRLHPDEPTKVRSRAQVGNWLAECGFELEKFSFGIRDAFTYAIVTAKRIEHTSQKRDTAG
jgi:SAM-dependent methyltransferase